MNGRSTVREVELKSGKVLRSKKLPKEDFGEGVTRHGDRCGRPLRMLCLQSGFCRSWHSSSNQPQRLRFESRSCVPDHPMFPMPWHHAASRLACPLPPLPPRCLCPAQAVPDNVDVAPHLELRRERL